MSIASSWSMTQLIGKESITKYVTGKNLPNLQINEVVLIHRNVVNDDFQQNLRVLCTSVPNRLFRKLIAI